MIEIKKSDSLINIILKIESDTWSEISLSFPFWHPLLHSYTSLKILKHTCGDKPLMIITWDKTAKKILTSLEIKYSIKENNTKDNISYEHTFIEYLNITISKYKQEVSHFFHNIYTLDKKKLSKEKWKIWFFLWFLWVSVILFFFVFYFAVNKTYVYITPEITIKTKAKNFIFKELDTSERVDSQNIIKVKKIEKLIYLTDTFWVQWITEEVSQRSKWRITIFNNLTEDISLLKNTRLEAPNWVIFKISKEIIIPAWIIWSDNEITPWTIQVNVESEIYDSNGVFVGSKANLEDNTYLEFPGLKSNKDKIYARARWDISWANDNIIKSVSQVDIDNATKILEQKLKTKGLSELKSDIEEKNKVNNVTQEILTTDQSIIYSNFEILNLDEISIWDNLESFQLSGTIKVTTYTYNKNLLISKFQNSIKQNILKWIEEINFINTDSLRISDTLYKTNKPFSIKATAEIEVFFIHNFLNSESIYIDRFKNTIAGLDKSEAIKVLLNNEKISNVQIDIRPFFIDTITNIPKNIVFKINER